MAQAKNGAMLAVIGLAEESIQALLKEQKIDSIDFANFNSPKQIILSGPADGLLKAKDLLSKSGGKCIPLAVSGAFHSRYMATAAASFERFIKDMKFSKLHTPVLANATVEFYSDANIKELLVKQITSPVRWDRIIKALKNKGEDEFIEMGPGKVLTRLLSQN